MGRRQVTKSVSMGKDAKDRVRPPLGREQVGDATASACADNFSRTWEKEPWA